MIRKLLFLAFAIVFVSSLAFAEVSIDSGDNTTILGPRMGPIGKTPVSEVIKVYDNDTGTGTSMNLAMVWDIAAGSTYGYYVKRASNAPEKAGNTQQFAGIMVSRTSKDSPVYGGIGYMCIRGLCSARISTTGATAGQRLVVDGTVTTGGLKSVAIDHTSHDVGTCLTSTGSNRQVWLD